jgi:hypothetical protein
MIYVYICICTIHWHLFSSTFVANENVYYCTVPYWYCALQGRQLFIKLLQPDNNLTVTIPQAWPDSDLGYQTRSKPSHTRRLKKEKPYDHTMSYTQICQILGALHRPSSTAF